MGEHVEYPFLACLAHEDTPRISLCGKPMMIPLEIAVGICKTCYGVMLGEFTDMVSQLNSPNMVDVTCVNFN